MKFFDSYYEIAKRTETNPRFHLWGSLSTISVLLGRKCFLPHGHFTIFPQLYVVIVAGSGKRKEGAISVARNLLRDSVGIKKAPNSASREALIDGMQDQPVIVNLEGRTYTYHQTAILASEFNEFVGGKHVSSNMIRFLTDIWDEDEMYRESTRGKGKIEVGLPYLTILGGCTPAWFRSQIKAALLAEGFLRRTMFVYSDEMGDAIPWPDWAYKSSSYYKDLERHCKRIYQLKGSFGITKKAKVDYEKFYTENRNSIEKRVPVLQDYYGAKHILLLKICMCLSAAYDNKMLIDCMILDSAIKIMEETENYMPDLFSAMGRNELQAYNEDIITAVAKGGEKGIKVGELYAKFYTDLNFKEMEEVLIVGEKQGRIRSAHLEGGLVYWASEEKTQVKQVDLFALVRQQEPRYESAPVKSDSNSLFDPVVLRLLNLQDEKKAETADGHLLKGKKT